MSFVRVVSSSSFANSWIRNIPAPEKFITAFKPQKVDQDDDGQELWNKVSIYKADSWMLEKACAAAVMFEGNQLKWDTACLVLRLSEELIESAELDIEQSDEKSPGKPQTCFNLLNQYHYDLSGEKHKYTALSQSIYDAHRDSGDRIIPITYAALFEGGLCLKLHSEISRIRKSDELTALLSKIESDSSGSYTFPQSADNPFGTQVPT